MRTVHDMFPVVALETPGVFSPVPNTPYAPNQFMNKPIACFEA